LTAISGHAPVGDISRMASWRHRAGFAPQASERCPVPSASRRGAGRAPATRHTARVPCTKES